MREIVLFTLVSVCGMTVQSFVGFAGSLVAIPLLAMFTTPREAVPTYNLVMIVVNALLVLETRRHIDWRRVGKLLVGGLIGIPIGVLGLKHLPTETISLGISGITIAFAVLFLLKVRVPLGEGARTQLSVGLLSGLLGGSISSSGPPVVVYGLARNWDKDSFRTTLLTYFLFLAVFAGLNYWCQGMITRRSLVISAWAVIPTLAGAWLGIVLKNRVSEKYFRTAVLVVVIAVGIMGIARQLCA